MGIKLTPAALARTRTFLTRNPKSIGLRFGVTKTGCSGWQHIAEMTEAMREGDAVFEQDGIRIYVDSLSLPVVDGTEIDVIRERLGEQFVFRNPHALEACGCGESFTTTVIPDLPVRELPSL